MNFLIDIGNSRLKWACSDGDYWDTGTEWVMGSELTLILDEIWQEVSIPDQVVAASVTSPERTEQINEWMSTRWDVHPKWVEACRQQLGVTNCYKLPETLGADRWAALIAAHSISKKPVTIIDCGTAVTVDALSGKGEFIGGMIFPGISMLRRCLVADTHNIQKTHGDASHLPACSTDDGMAAGTLYGLAGAIRFVLETYRERLGKEMGILLTGGNAEKIAPFLNDNITIEPDLVLKGLALIAGESK